MARSPRCVGSARSVDRHRDARPAYFYPLEMAGIRQAQMRKVAMVLIHGRDERGKRWTRVYVTYEEAFAEAQKHMVDPNDE